MIVKTLCGSTISFGYERVVHGKRGSYVEFTTEQLVEYQIWVPPGARWRLKPQYDYVYYHEWRSRCQCNTKIYYQRKTVKYADYKVGLWYVAEGECVLENGF